MNTPELPPDDNAPPIASTSAAFYHPEQPAPPRQHECEPYQRQVMRPLVLFIATCLSTFWVGTCDWIPTLHMTSFEQAGLALVENWQQGLIYMAAVLGILLPHEMGHFVMTLRYRIPASWPYFIPVPFTALGTMGAVIAMHARQADRRQLFDVGLAGPLAGLAVALPISWIGIQQLAPPPAHDLGFCFHNPLIFRILIDYLHPEFVDSSVLHLSQLNPFVWAGWCGMLITGLNMLPISQLDGGHVSYALLGRRAHYLARGVLIAAILYVLISDQIFWVLMVVLVTLMGTDHPPTADDRVPLGWGRRLIGYASLTIPILCFPPGISQSLQ